MMRPRRDAFHKLRILKYAEDVGSVVKARRYFGVGRVSFYRWKAAYETSGEAGAAGASRQRIADRRRKIAAR